MLESAQSGNMKVGVIGGSIGGVTNLGPLLCDFEPAEVLEKYRSGWEDVLDEIVAQLKPRGSVLAPRGASGPGTVGPYCRVRGSCHSSPADDFYRWVDLFDEDEGLGQHSHCCWPRRSRVLGSPWPVTS